jgi:hypothetical protein
MGSTSITAGEFANTTRARTVTRNTQVGQTNFAVIKKIKEMYAKPAMVLADWLGISERTAKRKLAGQRELSIEEVGKLIRSERGFEVVTAIMGKARPEWWRVCVPVMEAADIRKMQMAAQKRIAKALENALDEDRQLSAAISRAENLSVQDEDHMRGHIDALRSMRRVPDRAVAKRGK